MSATEIFLGGVDDSERSSEIEFFGRPHNPFDTYNENSSFEDGFVFNSGNSSEEPYYPLPSHNIYTWTKLIILIIIAILTIVGNMLVCLSVILVRKLRKPKNYLLVSLAISDLFVAIFVLPFAIIDEFYFNMWPLNAGLCDLYVSGDILLCTSSILNLCAVSCDRYRAITEPLLYSAETTPKRMLIVIFAVWLVSACVSLPPVLLLGNEYSSLEGRPICLIAQNFWYQIYATFASFYIPLCIMLVVYIKILRVVAEKKKQMSWKNSKKGKQRSNTTSSLTRNGSYTSPTNPLSNDATSTTIVVNKNVTVNGKSKSYLLQLTKLPKLTKKDKFLGGLKEHKASTTLGIIMSAFIFCWLPFFVLALIRPFLSVEIPGWLNSTTLWLGYVNSSLNPLIYATLNRDFRRPFKEILCLRCSTLDSLMKKEFYNEQYGSDNDNIQIRKKQSATVPLDPKGDYPVSL